mmetsp:Transcript_60165/g.162181  ORF Transcript_60165/g.162181 Transcript_60165/m.162181 type:complete len:257 (+) Transcript_60165:61-831(+)
MSREACAPRSAERRRPRLLLLLLAPFALRICWPLPCLSRAFAVAVPSRTARAATRRLAQIGGTMAGTSFGYSGPSKVLRDLCGTYLATNPDAKQSWQTFCKARDLQPLAPLDKQPLEAMEAFLADPAQYKQKELLEFLGLDTVNVPLKGVYDIKEDDPIIKSALVRELTLKQFRCLIAQDPEMNRKWSKFWVARLQALVGEDEDDARREMAMKSSFEKRKTPEPGTWDAMVLRERYFDGRSTVGEFDIDGGRDAMR